MQLDAESARESASVARGTPRGLKAIHNHKVRWGGGVRTQGTRLDAYGKGKRSRLLKQCQWSTT